MNGNESANESHLMTGQQTSASANEQGIQVMPELQQQISVLNARISNINLANSDLLRAVESTFKTLMKIIAVLQKQNAELKQKLEDATENSP